VTQIDLWIHLVPLPDAAAALRRTMSYADVLAVQHVAQDIALAGVVPSIDAAARTLLVALAECLSDDDRAHETGSRAVAGMVAAAMEFKIDLILNEVDAFLNAAAAEWGEGSC
jgi:hypothetical protein